MKNNKIGYRPTWAEVNLNNLAYNFRQIKKILSSKTKIMVCVKADAYGHGIVAIAKKLSSLGVDYLGVASIDEGIKLREANIRLPILILGPVLEKDIKPLFAYDLIPTVCTLKIAFALNKIARSMGKVMRIHIKVDTGMGRLGVLCKDALGFIGDVLDFKFIKIDGVFTHLACADVNKNYTLRQINTFKYLISQLRRKGINIPLFHAANSMGTIKYKESHFDMVRPGLAIYGLYPKEGLDIKLKAVLSLKTKVAYLKRVPSGFGISYACTYITKRNTTIVTLPIGYGDGYPRILSNKAEVLIKGRRFKISGRVCMDQIMVDTQDVKVNLGDEVVLIGAQKKNIITAEELAALSGTIPYEIVCGIGSRVPRIYID
jgi:alanine racemase